MASAENLAKRFFWLVESRDRLGLSCLLHPDVDFAPLVLAGDYRGRGDVMGRFYETVFSWTVYEAVPSRFVSASESTIRAEGRLRWMSNGELRDMHANWTLQFENGQLIKLRSGAAPSTQRDASRTSGGRTAGR